MAQALEGIRVLDLTRLLPGAFCTMLLADLGADVIKVEEPTEGDYARYRHPQVAGMSTTFQIMNRNKRSLTLNLKQPAGKDLLLRLAKDADVLVESFRPGVLDRLGVGYAKLSEANPRLVYAALTGYGQNGPYANLAGHDVNYLGVAGVLGVTGYPDRPPVIPGVQIADIGGGGLLMAFSILAALQARERTGRGQFADISMMDTMASFMLMLGSLYFGNGHIAGRGTEDINGGVACYNVYECQDGRFLTSGNREPKFWQNFVRAIGRPDLADKQYVPPDEQRQVYAAVAAALQAKTRDEWFELLRKEDVCVGPVNDIAEAFRDPQMLARGMYQEVEHPSGETIKHIGHPTKYSGTPATIRRPAPDFGEHTDEVLRSIGLDDQQLAQLRAQNIIR